MRAPLLACLAVLALTSCSLTRFEPDACRSTAECRATFGFGYTCGGDGICALTPLDRRCTQTWPSGLYANPAERDTRVIGTVIDGSEPAHVARANAVRFAVQDATRESLSRGGPRFGLVTCTIQNEATVPVADRQFDGLSRADATLRVVRHLEGLLDVPLVVGPPASGEVRAAFEATTRTLLLSPSATSPVLTALETGSDDTPGRVWRTAPTDVEQAEKLAADLAARGVRDVAVIAEQSTYGDGLVTELGARIVIGQLERFPSGNDNAMALAAATVAVGQGSASEVIVISSAVIDTVNFFIAATDLEGFAMRRFLLTDAAANRTLLDGLPADPSLRARIRGTRVSIDPTNAELFQTRYRTDTDIPADERLNWDVNAFSFSAHAYDAGWLAMYAVMWATLQEDRIDAGALGRGLRHVSSGVSVAVGGDSWSDVVAAFEAGQGIDVRGASGALDYDPDTEERSEGGESFEVWRITADGTGFCAVGASGCP